MKKTFALNLILAAIYIVFAKLGLELATLNNSVSPVWPATGFALAMVYIFGYRALYAVALGAFVTNATTHLPIGATLLITAGNTLEAFVGVYLIHWVHSQRKQFSYYTHAIAVMTSSVFGSLVSATIGTLAIFMIGHVSKENFGAVWLTWWIGDTLGGLVMLPLLTQFRKFGFIFRSPKPLVLVAGISLLTVYFVFASPAGSSYLFLIFPLLLLTLKTLTRVHVYIISAIIALISVIATVKGYGPCASGNLNDRLVHLQIFLASIAITSLTLVGIGRHRLTWLPVSVLMICWTLTGAIFYSFDQSERHQTQAHFEGAIEKVQEKISLTLEAYQNALKGGAGLFTASESITAGEWKNYSKLLELTQQHTGMHGMGVIWPVENTDLPKFSRQMKKEGLNEFAIKPVTGQRLTAGTHYIIKYSEPYEDNSGAIGLDISTEQNRRAAAENARDTGMATMTAKINIVIGRDRIPGFHLYFPIYTEDKPHPNTESRRKAHMGWIYSPVIYESFFKEVFSGLPSEVELVAYEGNEVHPEKMVFQNLSQNPNAEKPLLKSIDIGSIPFTFEWRKSPRFVSSHDTIVAWVGLCGALASLLMTCLMVSLQLVGKRSREMAQELTKELSDSRERFKEGERRLLYALDGSNDGIWDWNLAKSEMYMSGKLAETFGWPQVFSMRTADDLKEIAHPDDLKTMTQSVRNHIQGKTEYHEVETRYLSKKGVWRWVLTRGRISEWDATGKPVRMTGVHIDIDALKKAQQLLESTQYQLRQIADSVPTLISEWDSNLLCRFANKGFASWFGRSAESILGLPFYELLTSQEFEERKQRYDAVLQGQVQVYERKEVHRVTQEIRHLVSTCIPKSTGGKVDGFFLFIQDITELKKAELAALEERKVALEATSIKSQFLANMSHEIRTPINGIIGMTNLLKSTDLTPRQREYTDLVGRSSDLLLNLINDILDFSKIEAGKMELEIINFNLNQLAGDIFKSMSFAANEKSLSLVLNNFLSGQINFKGDPSRLRQVLMNLLSNAIKFTANGEVSLNIEERRSDSGKSLLRFEVKDTGIGIPESSLHRLFQAFSQADATTSRRFGGTGLGLSICKQLVHLMGGQIGVSSASGKGSTFWVEISLEHGEAIENDTKKNTPTKITRGARILIAEDNRVNQQIVFETLQGFGYHPHVVGNGIEALDALRDSKYDLILMDCKMPDMDGFEVTRIIRQSESFNIRQIPIIAMTASALRGDKEKCIEVGMNDYISKPMPDDDLLQMIEKYLNLTKIVSSSAEMKTSGHILVVEDNLVNQSVICANLEILSYSFEVAGNGIEALEMLRQHSFDLILMDCQMPEMDGYEATKQIRLFEDKKIAQIPIVALTANALRGDREKCLAAGMSDYMTKPLDVELLKRTLENWMTYGKKQKENQMKQPAPGSVIQLEAIQKLKKLQKPGRPDLVTNLINLYFESASESLNQMKQAIAQKDWVSLTKAAHSLKSSSANLGATDFAGLCLQLETAFDQGTPEEKVIEIFNRLETSYANVVDELKGFKIAA